MDHLVISMCIVVSCVIGKGCFLYTSAFFRQNCLAFALLYFVLQGQTCLLLQVSLAFFCIPVPYGENDIFFLVLVLEGLVGLKRAIQLLWH